MKKPALRLYIAEFEKCGFWMHEGASKFLNYIREYDMYIVYRLGASPVPPDYQKTYGDIFGRMGGQCRVVDAREMVKEDLHAHMLAEIGKYSSPDTSIYFLGCHDEFLALQGRVSGFRTLAEAATFRTGQVRIPEGWKAATSGGEEQKSPMGRSGKGSSPGGGTAGQENAAVPAPGKEHPGPEGKDAGPERSRAQPDDHRESYSPHRGQPGEAIQHRQVQPDEAIQLRQEQLGNLQLRQEQLGNLQLRQEQLDIPGGGAGQTDSRKAAGKTGDRQGTGKAKKESDRKGKEPSPGKNKNRPGKNRNGARAGKDGAAEREDSPGRAENPGGDVQKKEKEKPGAINNGPADNTDIAMAMMGGLAGATIGDQRAPGSRGPAVEKAPAADGGEEKKAGPGEKETDPGKQETDPGADGRREEKPRLLIPGKGNVREPAPRQGKRNGPASRPDKKGGSPSGRAGQAKPPGGGRKGELDRFWDRIRAMEREFFGDEAASELPEKTYSALDDSKARTADLTAKRLISNIGKLVPSTRNAGFSYDDYMEFIAALVKSENFDDFLDGWGCVSGGLAVDPMEMQEAYASLRKEAAYYATLCDMLYGKDVW